MGLLTTSKRKETMKPHPVVRIGLAAANDVVPSDKIGSEPRFLELCFALCFCRGK
jgi:hypothetical protein